MMAEEPKTVADLVSALQALDQTLPVHRHGRMGDFPAGWPELLTLRLALARSENYVFAVNDPTWSKNPPHSHPPFDALVIW